MPPCSPSLQTSVAAAGRRIGEDRPLCFLHIAKTGGTSVTDAIARFYPPDRVFTDHGNLSVTFLEGLGERLSGRVFLAGHGGLGVVEFLHGRADMVTVLRRPADQAVSNYLHVLSDPNNGMHSKAVDRSFSDFLRRNPDQIDYQTGALCLAFTGNSDRAHAIRHVDLTPLLRFLDDLPFVGVMERAEACGEVLSRQLAGGDTISLACLNSAVYRGVSVRTLRRLRHEYEALREDPRLAPVFAREARLHAAAAAALARLEQQAPPDARRSRHTRANHVLAASRFSTRSGGIRGSTIVASLLDEKGHLAYGPYDLLPPGSYAVEFRFAVKDAAPARVPRLQLEASANGEICLRRRWITAGGWTSPRTRTIRFTNDRASNVLEFRVRARGFTQGHLVFHGVVVSSSSPWRAWPSAPTRMISHLLRPLRRLLRPDPRHAPIPIEARASSIIR